MPEIHETRLPGIGVRYEFVTHDGGRVAVILHRSGRRDVISCEGSDPDVCHEVLRLTDDEAHALSEALGVSHVTEDAATVRLQLALGGLTIDWIELTESSPACGRSIYEVEHEEPVDASLVAVVRGGGTIASPSSTFVLRPHDTAVLVGTRDGVEDLTRIMTRG